MIAILASLLMLVTNLLDAQVDTPIGRHYENRHTLNSHSQLEFDNFWSPPIIVDLNGDGKDDVVFSELSPDIDGPSVFFIWVANESTSTTWDDPIDAAASAAAAAGLPAPGTVLAIAQPAAGGKGDGKWSTLGAVPKAGERPRGPHGETVPKPH